MTPFVIVAPAGAGRVRLLRTGDDGLPFTGPDGSGLFGAAAAVTVEGSDLARTVAVLEQAHPRWVWDDTSRWYPSLLAAGVRVERCVDLRLSHAILRHSTLTQDSELAMSLPGVFTSVAQVGVPAPASAASIHTPAPHSTLFDDLDDLDELAPSSSAGFGATDPRHSDRIPRVNGTGGTGDTDGPELDAVTDETPELAGRDHSTEDPEPDTLEIAEFRRQRDAIRTATDPSRIALLVAAESAGSLVAAEMQHAGLPWSAALHDDLLTRLLGPRPPAPGIRPARLEELLASIRTLLDDPTVNPDSPAELVKSLRRAGLNVSSTRSWELKNVDHPAIPPLLEYKKLARLLTANGWNWVDTWVREGRFHPNYIPGGVVTGRWASEGGGALQLPKQVRSAVVADPGWKLVVADAAQLEPRILAALAGDRAMAAAGRDRDLYDGIVASGAVDTRAHAKVGMLGAMYGGTTGESGRMLPRLARAYPAAIKFVEDAARVGEAGAVVTTRLGRTSPRPSDAWQDVQDEAGADNATEAARSRARSAARSWGRFTRNFVVQGTAAEWALCWISAIRRRLWLLDASTLAPTARGGAAPTAPTTPTAPATDLRLEQRPHLAFFLHDEVMVHTPAHLAEAVAEELRDAAREAGRLIFGDAPVQFPVTVAIVDSYDQAK
ncbi:bifunctional 3'-5' exonuclease/DNA polymerase [Herbiconiux sp. CPCC 205763]|uniref:DNA-directed DNA polymerase n=1 Tax=Herbiconiux aconitum TaxID=2970913 RepID=A0ABT2GPV7_9MICO|nr:bifunctional 3'-5' exonuclease/DNA polymerase [Herbiconiux aconitum]MCS5716806.1 bifunctional 3'-5' exonuclease/DNA polymerase [Herbiconiux aconitum]